MKPKLTWLLVPISLGAFIATWGGWAKLSTMTGYTETVMIPGQGWSTFNTGIVLPLTVEPFGALAMAMAFNPKLRGWARGIAGVMAVTTLVAAGVCQVVVHQLTVANEVAAPPEIVGVTSVLPVVALGLSGALAMLYSTARIPDGSQPASRGTSQWGSRLGRLAEAATNRVVSQLERPTRDPIPPSLGSSQRDIPVSPAPAGMDISAGQSLGKAAKPVPLYKDPEVIMKVVGWREEVPRPTTSEVAGRLGTSPSTADRVIQEAKKMEAVK